MFEDSLVESSGQLSRRNPHTMALSLAIQMTIGGLLLMLPLIYTQVLPEVHFWSVLEAPSPPVGPAPKSNVNPARPVVSQHDDVVRLPWSIPRSIAIVHDVDSAPSGAEAQGTVPGALPADGTGNSVISNLIRTVPVAVPKIAPQKLRVSSGIAQGLLIHQVTPQYPPLARQARIQGTVVLQAVIDKDGTVQGLRVISGHPMLTQAAMDAVRQWRYRPYSLNGEPVEVDTQINVNFTLSGG